VIVPKLGLTAAATLATLMAAPAVAHAAVGVFKSPSGNIVCAIDTDFDWNGKVAVDCQIDENAPAAPPPKSDCPQQGDERFRLEQGGPAMFSCYGRSVPLGAEQTTDYGQTHSAGPITCDGVATTMTCTDSSTGHFFRVSQDSYQLG
jgi:hypothetical protein